MAVFGRHDKAIFLLNFENALDLGEDVSGNERNGVASGVTQTASLGGRNNVATFNPASDSGIDFTAYLGLFNASSSLSFSGWVRLNTTSGIQSIVSASDETQGSRNIILFAQSGGLILHVRDDTHLFQINIAGVIAANTWYHVAFSTGPSGAKLWLNASLIGSNASTASISSIVTNRCQVGYNVDDDGSGNPRRELEFNGHMKDILLSTAELNQSTVSDIYDNDIYSYEVIHLLGQSNQIGRADIVPGIDDDYSIVAGKVFQWGYNAQARLAATNPLDYVNEFAGDMGQWLAMCNDLVPILAYKQAIMLTPGAEGGTGFSSDDWNPGDSLYENVLTRMNQSMGYHALSNLRATHWMHGGTDAQDGATATYQASLEAMYDDLTARATGFSENVPFIAVTNSEVTANRILINSALAAFVADGSERYLVDATDLTTIDGVHYDAVSLREIGSRSADILLGVTTVALDDIQLSIHSDSVVLIQSAVLDVQPMIVPMAAQSVDLLLFSTLDIAELNISLVSDAVVLEAGAAEALSVFGVDISIAIDDLAIQQANLLAVADVALQSSSDAIVLLLNSVVSVADVSLSISVGSVDLGQSNSLVVADVGLLVDAESPVLLQQNALLINDARLSILMDSLTIGGGVFVTESALGMIVRDFQYVLLVEG